MNFITNLLMFLLVLFFGFFAIFVAIGVGTFCAIKEYGGLLKRHILKIFGKEDVHPEVERFLKK